MKNFDLQSGLALRAGLLLGGCVGIIAACSSAPSPSGEAQAGAAGIGGSAQAGKGSGGAQAGKGSGGNAQAGKGGTAPNGGTNASAGQAGESAANTGDAGAGPGAIAGAASGGESMGGSGAAGEAGSSDEAGAGGSGVCAVLDPKLAPVDQKQLGGNPDGWNVYDAQPMGQFITVGKAGLLSGVELSLAVSCGATVGSLELDVYDAVSSELLGKGTVAMSALACQTGGVLAADTVGAAFFDLSSQCIAVSVGVKLRVELHLSGVPGTCTADHCVGGPAANAGCTNDANCTGIIISASEPSTYAGGSIEIGGVAGSLDDNLNFKTFVSE